MPPKDKYSDPELRDQVKEEIHKGDKGGAPGQWSARKAQMMASEYKKRGGGYNTDKSEQDESQKHLSKWGEEDWQTKEGSGNAKQADGTEKRYLPKKAWENMTEEEKEQTDKKKLEESKEGKQHVGNTEKAKESRQKANKEEDEKYEKKKQAEKEQKSHSKDEEEGEDGEEEYQDDGEADDDEDGEEGEEGEEEGADGDEEPLGQVENEQGEDDGEEQEEEDAKAGQKRKGNSKQANGSSKKQKSEGDGGNAPKGKVGSKHMDADEPAPRGSADRLPKKGQKISWKSMPGWVDGEVTEVLTSGKKVDGKDVKASEKDPKIVMKSSSSGKICVHKPEACCYQDE